MNNLLSKISNQALSRNLLKSSGCQSYKTTITRLYGSESAAYDGDGKTTVSVLNRETNLNLVDTYSNRGFRVTGNLFLTGSIILFPTHMFSWNVKRGIDITPESLIVFDLIVPKVKIIVIGYGQQDEPHNSALPMLLKKKGISCEMLPTPHAVTTYNYLVCDSVPVGGAFLPVRTSSMTQRDLIGLVEEDNLAGDYNKMYKDLKKDDLEYYGERYKELNRDIDKRKFDE